MFVELICDGGPTIGYGHIRRSLTLADALRNAGMRVRVSGMSTQANLLLPLQPEQEGCPTVVVFDAPYGVDRRIRAAREAGRSVIALDWFGEEEPDVAIAIYPHHTVRSRKRSYVGLEFQMIRAEITEQPRCIEGQGVVVLLGGGDLLGLGPEAAKILTEQGIHVTLVNGPLAADVKEMAQVDVLVKPPDLASRLTSCAWMVTNGGGCMFEAMFLGKAVVVLPQTSGEKIVAESILGRGGILGIGLQALRRYKSEVLRPVAHSAAALIDGRGAQRVADILLTLS